MTRFFFQKKYNSDLLIGIKSYFYHLGDCGRLYIEIRQSKIHSLAERCGILSGIYFVMCTNGANIIEERQINNNFKDHVCIYTAGPVHA